jgi:hypothetical protein
MELGARDGKMLRRLTAIAFLVYWGVIIAYFDDMLIHQIVLLY